MVVRGLALVCLLGSLSGSLLDCGLGGLGRHQTLVDDGVTMQRNAQKAAEAKIAEATEKMTTMAQQFTQQASVLGQKATGQWDRLESIFEERVAKAMQNMGLPSAQDLADLQARVSALEAEIKAMKSEGKG